MRIGLIAPPGVAGPPPPPWVPVPPPAYGGTEVVIDNLARGLQALGHEVRLFTVGKSTCPVPREYLYQSGIEPMGADVPEAAHALAAYEAFADCDIIHDHTALGPLLASQHGIRRPPVVTTSHGPFTAQTRRIFATVARHASIVAISHSQARSAGRIPIAAGIYHGIDPGLYQIGSHDALPISPGASSPRSPGTPRSWRSRPRRPAPRAGYRSPRSSTTGSTWTCTSPGPDTAATRCLRGGGWAGRGGDTRW